MPTYEQLEEEIADAQRLGDLDKLDELLSQVSDLSSGDNEESSPSSGQTEGEDGGAADGEPGEDPKVAAKPADGDAGQQQAAPGAGESGEPIVRAKDGVNEIPYSVLEAERAAAAQARQQIAELQAQLDEARRGGQQTGGLQGDLEDLQAMNQLLVEQLKEAGMSPRTTPDRFELSDEVKRELKEEYGVVGSTIADLADAVAALRGRLSADVQRDLGPGRSDPAPAGPSIQETIQADPDLSRWVQDPAAWAVAQHVDAQLANSPGYVGKPFSERRAEVVAVTRRRLGEAPAAAAETDIAAKADAAVSNAQRQRAPASLTDVGGEAQAIGKPLVEDMAGMSQVEIQAKLEALHARGGQKAVDAFLDEVLG